MATVMGTAGLFLLHPGSPAQATSHGICMDGGTTLPLTSVEFLRSYRPGLHAPARLAIDGADNIYVADPARNQIVVRAPDGRVIGRQTFEDRPDAIAVSDAAGGPLTIYVGDSTNGRVTAYAADWQPLLELGQGAGEFVSVNDIAVEPATGNIYVADGTADLIKVYAPDGAAQGSFGNHGTAPGQFDFPAAIAIDPVAQEVLVADQMNFRVQIFDLLGNFRCRVGDANAARDCSGFCASRLFTVPAGIAVDVEGRIYVADAAEGRIRAVDRNGGVRAQIGSFGQGAGQLRVPLDLVLDSHGRLFASDSNNRRLSVYGLEAFTDPELYAAAVAVVTPDPFDHLGTDPRFTAVIEIPGYPLGEVVLGSITANNVPLEAGSAEIGDHDRDGEPDIRVTFDRTALAATLPDNGLISIELRGLMTTFDFQGLAFITTSRDSDGDGVGDDFDLCPDTPIPAAIDGAGCTIAQLCPCEAQITGEIWAKKGDYVTCTSAEARRFADAGLIGRAEIGGIVNAAARAQCPGGGG